MATSITSSLAVAAEIPKNLHAGAIVVTGSVGHGAQTFSNGLELLLCKIPHRATVVDCWMRTTFAGGAGAGELNLGIDTNEDLFIASISVSNSFHRATLGLPFRVSVTDNARSQFVFLTATCGSGSITPTTSLVCNFGVMYVMDDPSL